MLQQDVAAITAAVTGNHLFTEVSACAADMGVPVYIVGGYVRDILLQRTRVEIDFLVVGDGAAFAEKLAARLSAGPVAIFATFGTAHFRYQDVNLEFVGARRESYSPESRNPAVLPGTFEEDMARRDFTVNALAVSLNSGSFGTVIDPFNGYADLQAAVLRTPLDPEVTFTDDPLRMMRAFRFAAQLGFAVDSAAYRAITYVNERIKIIVPERIKDELLKILASPRPSIGLIGLYESGLMQYVFPEIANLAGVDQRKEFHHKDVFYHTCLVVDNIARMTDNVWLRFAALVHDIAKPPTKRFVEGTGWTFHGHEELGARMMKSIFRRMRLPFAHLEYVEKLVRLHLRPVALSKEEVTDSGIRRLIVEAGDALDDLITLCRADITSKNPAKVAGYLQNYDRVMERVRDVREKDRLRAFQSPVRGDEIMAICSLPPSKLVGIIKKDIEDAIIEGKIANTYEDAYAYLLLIKDKYLTGA